MYQTLSYIIIINKRERKPKEKSRIYNLGTLATYDIGHRTKTRNTRNVKDE